MWKIVFGKKKNKIKRTIGGIGGGILSIPFFVGLFIPGVDVLELGIMAPLIGGAIVEGGNTIFIIKKGMKISSKNSW